MSKFSFTSPDGQTFEILGPANATAEQARAIFDQQVKSGGLVGLRAGDIVNANTQAAAGLRSALSQVGIRLPSSIEQAFAGLKNVPVSNPISAVDFIKQPTPNFSLGPLSQTNVQALMAQSAAQSGQGLKQVSADTGIGKFGLNIDKLETTGFVKPGTAAAYEKASPPSVSQQDRDEAAKINAEGGNITAEQVARNRQLNSFLTPSVFTGKNGVDNLQTVLADENVQNIIQQTGLKQNYDLLVRSGTAIGLTADKLGGLLQTASTFDAKTAVDWAKGLEVKNIDGVKLTAKAGEYATNFVDRTTQGIQTQATNLGALTTQIGGAKNLEDVAKLSGPLSGNLSALAGEIGQLGGLASTLGLGGSVGQVVGTVGAIAGGVSTVGAVASQLSSLSGIASQINNATTFSGLASGISSGIGVVTGVIGLVSGLFGGRGGSIYQGVRRPTGVINTVNRVTVDSSMQAILGNPKITTPSFSPQSSQILGELNALKALSGVANMQLRLTGQTVSLATNPTAEDVRLTYTGSDPIVWDRINLERLRLGLPGLAAIGLPKPESAFA